MMFFFFSSRRRHTRFDCDWSSDVCSSDLGAFLALHPDHVGWLDGVDLAIHEAGHPLFGVFGEFIGFLGGTLMQLLMPSLFVWYFTRRGDRHAATVALWWVAQNLWNVSVYVKDARAEELPLVG